QDNSPIQARGFSLFRLSGDRIEPGFYWYNAKTQDFIPEDSTEWSSRKSRRWRVPQVFLWLWSLADPEQALERMSILMIALLAAFLTVVQIWQIPPVQNPLKDGTGSTSSDNTPGGAQTTDAKPAFDASPFASNFGKTVILGLGGLAAQAV